MLFGAAYYPEHCEPSTWDSDIDLMAGARVNCVRVAEFAWSRFEPEEGKYDFAWLDSFAEKAWKKGVGLLLCPPLRTVPAWMVENDSTVRLEREDGVVLEYGSRYSFCINNPYLRERGRMLAEEMGKHYGNADFVLGWHMDNEHGDEPDCHCPICRNAFQEYCARRYGNDIGRLNECWGLEFWGLNFNHFGQVPTPRASKTFHSPGHYLAWRRFRSESTINALRVQIDAARPHCGAHQFITTNNQVMHNQRTDYYDMAQHLDVTGTNYYPPYGDNSRMGMIGLANVRGYGGGENFHIHELRNSPHMIPGAEGNMPAPGEVERLTLHGIGNGANGIFYFRWRACHFGCEQSHGSVTDFGGRPLRAYEEVKRLGTRLAKLGERIDRTRVKSDVALLFDFPTRWVMDAPCYWNGPQGLFINRHKDLYNTIRRQGVNCDTTGRESDWSGYRVLVVGFLSAVDNALAEKLARFVEDGGTLVWHPFCGVKDEESRIFFDRIHPALQPLLNADIRNYGSIGNNESEPFEWNGKEYAAHLFCDLAENAGGEVQARFVSASWGATPAILRNTVGKGTVHYLTAFPEPAFYDDYLKHVFGEAKVEPVLPGAIPDAVEVVEKKGADELLVFLLNHSAEEQTVTIPAPATDIYNEEELQKQVTLPPYGARILSYPMA